MLFVLIFTVFQSTHFYNHIQSHQQTYSGTAEVTNAFTYIFRMNRRASTNIKLTTTTTSTSNTNLSYRTGNIIRIIPKARKLKQSNVEQEDGFALMFKSKKSKNSHNDDYYHLTTATPTPSSSDIASHSNTGKANERSNNDIDRSTKRIVTKDNSSSSSSGSAWQKQVNKLKRKKDNMKRRSSNGFSFGKKKKSY